MKFTGTTSVPTLIVTEPAPARLSDLPQVLRDRYERQPRTLNTALELQAYAKDFVKAYGAREHLPEAVTKDIIALVLLAVQVPGY